MKRFRVLLSAVVILFFCRVVPAQTIEVNEKATRLILREDQGSTLMLAVNNRAAQPLDARLEIEVLSSDDKIQGKAEVEETIPSGEHFIRLPFFFCDKLIGESDQEALWYRLRYKLEARNGAAPEVSGILAVSEIIPQLFDIRMASSRGLTNGSFYPVHVHTVQAVTSKAAGGVAVAAKLELGDDEANALTARGVTDREGNATLTFTIPAGAQSGSADLTVTASKGGIRREVSSSIDFVNTIAALISTDKPIYQPGQVVHMRALLISKLQQVQANTAVNVTVTDPENTTVFHDSLQSSRFGIVHADWQIPENQRLGDYTFRVSPENGDDGHWLAEQTVKISRYELPNFVVNVKPDRAYYLPGQNAEVRVEGQYLFGKPVKHGHVRVVREDDRRWNYKDQKWEIDEGDHVEGELDADGGFAAHFNLKEEEDNLPENDNYTRFKDLHYAAYITDATTRRTEQRRFDVRITRSAIHVYYLSDGNLDETPLPMNFYLLAQYADGAPCACEITIHKSSVQSTASGESTNLSMLRSVHLNRYGLAKITDMPRPQFAEDEEEHGLVFEARDGKGTVGRHWERFYPWGTTIHVTTDRSLYNDGDPIQVSIQSGEKDSRLTVEVSVQSKLIEIESVTLRHGRAWLTIPYSLSFKDEVKIVAYDMQHLEDRVYDYAPVGGHTVLYPRKHGLNLKVQLDKASFRPGEDAQADFQVFDPNGQVVESALALAVTDKAVDERARTEQDFQSRRYSWWSYGGYWFDASNVAGFTRADLDKIDMSRPVPADLDMVAEIILSRQDGIDIPETEESGQEASPEILFRDAIQESFVPMVSALNTRYDNQDEYPTEEATFTRFLEQAGVAREQLRDPWGTVFKTRFYREDEFDKIALVSAGPDKIFGTADDFEVNALSWPYFHRYGWAMNKAADEYYQRTGQCIRDEATLKEELKNRGIAWEKAKDTWGEPVAVRFNVQGRLCILDAMSGGPDKVQQASAKRDDNDDIVLWTSRVDFLSKLEAQVRSALADYYEKSLVFPGTQSDLEKALEAAGLSLGSPKMRDPWGASYYPVFGENSFYADHVTIQASASSQKTQSIPVTTRMKTVRLRSSGPNGVKGDSDDFDLAQFSILVAEQSAGNAVPQPVKEGIVLRENTGAIAGSVSDPQGAVIPDATVTVVAGTTNVERVAKTNGQGEFVFEDLPPGVYNLRCESPGFMHTQVTTIWVLAQNITRVNITLKVGATSETVEVQAVPGLVETSSAEVSQVKQFALAGLNRKELAAVNPDIAAPPISTPRLREYFPETLLWQPELITDKHGRSHLKFKLADNITSWKMAVFASDANGEVGSAEKEFTAFQPFFVDHDPPPVLTQNDEISLPVVLRNYLNKPQRVNVDMKPESWFTLLGEASQHADVPAGDSSNAIFLFRATAAVHEGKQRVTAIGGDASDAIERKVSVHPDGEEEVITQGQIFSSQAQFSAALPDSVIPGSVHAELKIYPNLMAHVMESIEGSLERPYGCGEQTISSTYPNLLVLRAYKAQGIQGPNAALAMRYLQTGYDRLLSYRSSEGGFTYWGRGEPDFAVTAYAIQFLNDAKEFIAVDDSVISSAQLWLLQEQAKSGSWSPTYKFANSDYAAWYELSTTSYVTRVLAQTLTEEEKKQSPSPTNLLGHLHSALDYLGQHVQETDEPYFIVNYALAASALGEQPAAAQARERLRSLAHESNGEAYWELQRNTPFYGWGTAGRVETTALVLRALAQGDDRSAALLLSGLRFLLHEKDRYGVWYSGQATVNVLKALIDLADAPQALNKGENHAEVKVNGNVVKTVAIPVGKEIVNPIIIDLSEFFSPGENQVELAGASEAARSSAQLLATYYVPWSQSKIGKDADQKPGDSDILRLSVHYDKTEAKIGEEIHCHVEVERIGFRGYGMMLAEIGLPPAADVDRESLDRAIENAGWSLNHYDILPDRLIAYVWPHYGGGATQFEFTFRPRMAEAAQTAPSILYDYYNPEARAVVAPNRFTVH